MIKREHIKQAIDEITLRSPEVGYSLDELLGVGRINTLPPDQAIAENGDFRFQFRDEILTVRRFLFINHGHLPIEQQMLIKYGEMRKRREVLDAGTGLSYRTAAEEVRAAGLRFLVDYELERALDQLDRHHSAPSTARVDGRQGAATGRTELLRERLAQLKAETSNEPDLRHRFSDEGSENPLFGGCIGTDTPALFVVFPYCRKALEQAAELNLEFFSIRFLLNTLIRGNANRLFACIVRGHLAGLIYLNMKVRLFYRALEVGYLATVQGRIPALVGRRLRGVGSFLVAGTWLLWKTSFPRVREIVLDSESGAIRFYQAIGFQARGTFSYTLRTPRGYLLDSLVGMAEGTPDLPTKVLEEIATHLRKQIKALAKVRSGSEKNPIRRPTLRAARRSMLSRHHALLAKASAEALLKYRSRIPEANELLRIASEFSNLRFPKEPPETGERLVAVVHDLLFTEHLQGIFHMESPQRIRAVAAALQNNAVAEKWKAVPPRPASDEELAWVHTRSHIERIARTAGKEIVSLDLDTQTTPRSFEVARLAVGGVFNLLDEIWNGDSRRGFAFVRPPGHHAEPDKAMGFCLFNNTALGARYLERVYGLERIMIVDIDAHHGNGTQAVFYPTNTVLYASLHEFPSYPGTGNLGEVGTGCGEGFTVNIPMARGSGDGDFAQAIYGIIRPVAEEYEPEALLVSCGFDLCRADRLTKMNGTAEGYALMAFFLKEIADQVCDGKLIYILEGGYNVGCVEECTLRTLQELSDINTLDPSRLERIRSSAPHRTPALRRVIEAYKKYWKSLG